MPAATHALASVLQKQNAKVCDVFGTHFLEAHVGTFSQLSDPIQQLLLHSSSPVTV